MNPEVLSTLLDQHSASLELYASQWTGIPADVVQEAFIQLARQQPLPAEMVPWLYRVVRNRAISAARSAGRRRKHEALAAQRSEPWFADGEGNEIDAQLATEALRSLPENQREIVIARIWGGLSFDQIAEIVEVSSSTAHRRYAAALAELRERLEIECLTKNPSPKT